MIGMTEHYMFSKQKQLLWQQEARQDVGLFVLVHGSILGKGMH